MEGSRSSNVAEPLLINTTEIWFSNTFQRRDLPRVFTRLHESAGTGSCDGGAGRRGGRCQLHDSAGGRSRACRNPAQLDITGNAVPYSGKVWVTLEPGQCADRRSLEHRHRAADHKNTVVTIDHQQYRLGRRRAYRLAGTVTVTPVTDGGVNRYNNLNNTSPNETANVVFSSLFAPTMSSTANIYFTAGTAQTLGNITVDVLDNATVTTGNDIRIRIPPSWSPVLITALRFVVDHGNGSNKRIAAGSSAGFTYTTIAKADDAITLDVTTDFVAGDTIIIGSLAFTTVSTPSSGILLSVGTTGGEPIRWSTTRRSGNRRIAQDMARGKVVGSETSWKTANNYDSPRGGCRPARAPSASPAR